MSDPRETNDDAKWFVGLTYTTELNSDFDDVTPTVWLRPTDEQKVIPVPADSGWVIFNLQSTGKRARRKTIRFPMMTVGRASLKGSTG